MASLAHIEHLSTSCCQHCCNDSKDQQADLFPPESEVFPLELARLVFRTAISEKRLLTTNNARKFHKFFANIRVVSSNTAATLREQCLPQ